LVRVLQGFSELHAKIDDLLPGHLAAAGEDVVDRLAVDVLHGVVRGAVVAADAEQAHDVRMIELLEDGGFTVEAGGGAVAAEAGSHDLDGDALAGLAVGATIDGPHGAAAQLLVDSKRPKLLADEHRTV